VVKPPLRTKTLGTKVSEEEFAQLEAAAGERGLTLNEWCREVLLATVNGQLRIPADADRHSWVIPITIPERNRSPFSGEVD
jgi:hypothetical protein